MQLYSHGIIVFLIERWSEWNTLIILIAMIYNSSLFRTSHCKSKYFLLRTSNILHTDSLKPKSVIRQLRPNNSFFASILLFLGYNGITLRPQNIKTSAKKITCYHHNANDRFGLKIWTWECRM